MTREERTRQAEIFQKLLASGEEGVFGIETEAVDRNGDHHTLIASAVILYDQQGNAVGTMGTSTDITARKRAEILATANAALAQSLDLDAVLDTLLDYLRLLVPYDSANVMLLENETMLRVRAARGYEKWTDAAAARQMQFDPRAAKGFGQILRERRSYIIPDSREFPGWVTWRGAEHVISWMGIPLVVGGQVIGVYSVDKVTPNFFTDAHRLLAEGLAAQAAIAIQNARLLASVSAQSEQLRALARYLQTARENERTLVAREIHDEFGSALTALKIDVTWIAKQLPKRKELCSSASPARWN